MLLLLRAGRGDKQTVHAVRCGADVGGSGRGLVLGLVGDDGAAFCVHGGGVNTTTPYCRSWEHVQTAVVVDVVVWLVDGSSSVRRVLVETPVLGGGAAWTGDWRREGRWRLRVCFACKWAVGTCTQVLGKCSRYLKSLVTTGIDSVSESICFTGLHNANNLRQLLLTRRGLVISEPNTRPGAGICRRHGRSSIVWRFVPFQRPATVPRQRIDFTSS